MVPIVALPPGMLFTCQLTSVSLVLARLAVRVSVAPACTLPLAGQTPSATAGALVEQEPCPAADGAAVVTELEVMTTLAVSVWPASSVTVSATVPTPQDGPATDALEVAAPVMASM